VNIILCTLSLDDWSKLSGVFGGILGPIIAGIAAYYIYKTLKAQNSANDFNICLTLYHDILDYIDELEYPSHNGKIAFALEAINIWIHDIEVDKRNFDPHQSLGLDVTLLFKDFDECSRKIEESSIATSDKNFLMDKVGYLYYAVLKANIEKLIEFFQISNEHRDTIKYYKEVNDKIIQRRKNHHL
jgi:hypothetical protein